MNYKKLLLFFFLAAAQHLSAQNRTDTVETARKLAYAKNYNEAITLLQQFEISHPKDINSVRLHGQILYWTKDFDGAFHLYEAALKVNPKAGNPTLMTEPSMNARLDASMVVVSSQLGWGVSRAGSDCAAMAASQCACAAFI